LSSGDKTFTLVILQHDHTPEGYRREIERLRALVHDNPDDDGYKLALEGIERTLKRLEATLNNKDEEQRLLAKVRERKGEVQRG
jgi:hypothetical protein